MAESKTEQPTEKRLRDARKKGQVFRSTDFTNAVLFLAAAATLSIAGPPLVNQLRAFLAGFFQPENLRGNLAESALLERTGYAFVRCMLYVAPFLAVVLVVSSAANLLQVRPLFAAEVLKPDLKKMNPIEGFKRILGKPKTYLELAKNLVKFAVILWVAYYAIRGSLAAIAVSPGYRPAQTAALAWSLLLSLFYRIGAIFLAIGAADYMLQRKLYMKELMMSKDEVRKEFKEEEGDPHVKQARRQMHMELLAEASMARVPKAAVVVVNPTHMAVALEYKEDSMNAPRVAAKGQRLRAQQIIDLARRHKIPILRNVPLAHGLFEIEIGQEIPESLYEAVAEVLNWLYQLQQEEASA